MQESINTLDSNSRRINQAEFDQQRWLRRTSERSETAPKG